MPGLELGIHAFMAWRFKDVDDRVKPGHDGERVALGRSLTRLLRPSVNCPLAEGRGNRHSPA
jgi:hypothetical protein